MWKIILGSISFTLSIILLIGSSIIEDLNGNLPSTCETLCLIGAIFMMIPVLILVWTMCDNI